MAEEKHLYGHKGGHFFFMLGVLAVIFGVTQYLMLGLGWPSYSAWIAGGILLLAVAWMKMNKMEK